MSVFNPELAWIDGTFKRNKSITVEDGSIVAISDGDGSDKGAFLPGFINAHSHAFQRALRGKGEQFTQGSDTFWGWRDEMYALVNSLTVEEARDICITCFTEMLHAGITTVGEFHYFHHAQETDFKMDQIVLEAASEVGIRIVLLHACYKHGGFDKPLANEQSRFHTPDLTQWWKQVDALASQVDGVMQRIGTVAHSVRAVDIDSIVEIVQGATSRNMPMHIHLEEQRQEIAACEAKHGATPMALLLGAIEVSPLMTAVHCTHTTASDLEGWVSAGGNICLCPMTEANLADGVCDMKSMIEHDGCIALGSDSNARISMLEEMRWMEYAQRLSQEERGICVDALGDMARYLLQVATMNGATSLGIPAGAIEVGNYADFTVVDVEHVQLEGITDEALAAAICCGADNSVVSRTIIAGK